MSKPTTLEQRAAEYVAEVRDMRGSATSLAQFAAREVARVREMQAPGVRAIAAIVEVSGPARMYEELATGLRAIEAATRPERPARAKAPKLPAWPRTRSDVDAFNGPLPNGGVVTDVNHKPVKRAKAKHADGCGGTIPSSKLDYVHYRGGVGFYFCSKGCMRNDDLVKRREPGLSALAKSAKRGKGAR